MVRSTSLTGVGFVLLTLLGACKEQPQPSARPAASQAASPSSAPAESVAAPPVAAPVVAPFVVTLEGPNPAPAKGPVELTLVIESPKGFGGQTTVSVELPKGAKLASGAAKETLASLPEGKTTKKFKVTLPQKLTSEAPVRFVVEGSDPAGQFGARAERVYPEKGGE